VQVALALVQPIEGQQPDLVRVVIPGASSTRRADPRQGLRDEREHKQHRPAAFRSAAYPQDTLISRHPLPGGPGSTLAKPLVGPALIAAQDQDAPPQLVPDRGVRRGSLDCPPVSGHLGIGHSPYALTGVQRRPEADGKQPVAGRAPVRLLGEIQIGYERLPICRGCGAERALLAQRALLECGRVHRVSCSRLEGSPPSGGGHRLGGPPSAPFPCPSARSRAGNGGPVRVLEVLARCPAPLGCGAAGIHDGKMGINNAGQQGTRPAQAPARHQRSPDVVSRTGGGICDLNGLIGACAPQAVGVAMHKAQPFFPLAPPHQRGRPALPVPGCAARLSPRQAGA
jgi:hypothetical protein